MALLKTKTHRDCSSVTLQKYLEEKNGKYRILAMDWSDTVSDPDNWGEEFDDWRKSWNKDEGITLRHFVISPDPENNASLEQVRALATKWAKQFFGSEGQWIIAYHNDNGKMHAHIALNWVRMDGRKWRLEGGDYSNIANALHDMTREMGLTCDLRDVGWDHKNEINRCKKITGSEKAIQEEGRWSWKEDLRFSIDECAPKSFNYDDFCKNLKAFYGVTVKINGRGGFTFTHRYHHGENNHRFVCRDYKLGAGYTVEAIEAKFSKDLTGFLKGGKIDRAAYSLSMNKRTRELLLTKPRLYPPKPRNKFDRLERMSMREGLDEVRKMSKAISLIGREATAAGLRDKNGKVKLPELLKKVNDEFDSAANELASAERERKVAVDIHTNIKAFNDTLDVYSEYESKGVLAKGKFKKEHIEEITKHEKASDWLKTNGFTDLKFVDLDKKEGEANTRMFFAKRAEKNAQQAYKDAEEKLRELNETVSYMASKTRPLKLRDSHAGGVSQACLSAERSLLSFKATDEKSSKTTRSKLRHRRVLSIKDMPNAKKGCRVKFNPEQSKQDVEAIQSAFRTETSRREVALLKHEHLFEKRLVKYEKEKAEAEKKAALEKSRAEKAVVSKPPEPRLDDHLTEQVEKVEKQADKKAIYWKDGKRIDPNHTIAAIGKKGKDEISKKNTQHQSPNKTVKQRRQR